MWYIFLCICQVPLKKIAMRYYYLLFVLLSLLTLCNTGQLQAQAKVPEVQKALLTSKGLYRFPAFTEGSIVFRNGIMSAARMNYNISLDEMHFVSQEGDTLALAEPATISFINLNGSRFYFDKGYIQSITEGGGVILGFRQTTTAQTYSEEGYEIKRGHEGIRRKNYYGDNGLPYSLGDNDEIRVTTRAFYFFGDNFGRFEKTSKAWVYQHFPDQQAAIAKFLQEHHINFNKPSDLTELLQFCATLTSEKK